MTSYLTTYQVKHCWNTRGVKEKDLQDFDGVAVESQAPHGLSGHLRPMARSAAPVDERQAIMVTIAKAGGGERFFLGIFHPLPKPRLVVGEDAGAKRPNTPRSRYCPQKAVGKMLKEKVIVRDCGPPPDTWTGMQSNVHADDELGAHLVRQTSKYVDTSRKREEVEKLCTRISPEAPEPPRAPAKWVWPHKGMDAGTRPSSPRRFQHSKTNGQHGNGEHQQDALPKREAPHFQQPTEASMLKYVDADTEPRPSPPRKEVNIHNLQDPWFGRGTYMSLSKRFHHLIREK